MAFKGLSVNVSGDADSAVASLQALKAQLSEAKRDASDADESLEELGDSANSAAASLTALSGSATTAAGSVRLLGRRSRQGAAGFGLMASKASALAVGLGALSAVAVPLTATLGALATAAGGVATGFTAVIGTGLFAYGEQLASQNEERLAQIDRKIAKLEKQKATTEGLTESQQQQLNSLRQTREKVAKTTSATGALSEELKPVKEQFRESALAIGQDFIPLMRDTIDALPEFIRRLEDSVGNLQPFAAALRDAGQAGMTVIPALVEQMMDMGRDALPAVRRLASFISDNAVPALERMATTGDRVTSMLPNIGSTAAEALPAINEFGLSILETTIPALRNAGSAATNLIERFNELDARTQKLSLGAALSAPAVVGVVSKLALINPILGAVAGGIAALGAAWTTNFGNIQEITADVADEVRPALVSLRERFITLSEDLQAGRFESALEDMVSAAEDGVNDLRLTLVGGTGRGGMLGVVNSATTQAQEYLQGPGGDQIQSALAQVAQGAGNAFLDFETILIGPDGSSGIIGAAVDQSAVFLSKTAPRLFGDAAEAIGSAFRAGLLDLLKPLSGEQSVILDSIADISKSLIRLGVDGFIAVGQALVKGLLRGFQGLVRGLIGAEEGEITQAFRRVISRAKRKPAKAFSQVGSALVDAIKTGVTGLVKFGQSIMSDIAAGVRQKVGEVATAIRRAIPNSVSVSLNIVSDALGEEFSGEDGAPIVGPPVPTPGTGDGGIDGNPLTPFATGGFVESITPALLHPGERVLPEQQVSERGEASFDPSSVARGFDQSETAMAMRDSLQRLNEAVRSDGTVRVRERDVVESLQRMFEQQGQSL